MSGVFWLLPVFPSSSGLAKSLNLLNQEDCTQLDMLCIDLMVNIWTCL